MLNDSIPEPTGRRNFLVTTAVVLLLGGVYLGWVFYSRWEANQAIEEKAREKRRLQDQESFEMMGGNRFEILNWYATPPSVRPGEATALCYSVSNAKSVKIEPPSDEPVWPAFGRCVHVSPRKTTTYTLTIDDGAGHMRSAEVEVEVR